MSNKNMQHFTGLVRKAIQDYEMIAPGDKILVAISGGKDSVALACALGALRSYLNIPFEIIAVTLDLEFSGKPTDYSLLAERFAKENIAYIIRKSDIARVVFDIRAEKNPCALCANLRRGSLHSAAQELGCNKVALGHHLDDAIETFYMNLWHEGRIGCFSPVTYLDRRNVTIIRPMALCPEADVIRAVKEAQIPVVKSKCPVDGVTTRQKTKDFVHEMCAKDQAFRQKSLRALQDANVAGWKPKHTGRMKK